VPPAPDDDLLRPADVVAGPAARRAAVVLSAIGPELAAKVYEHLSEEEIEQVTLDLAQAEHLPSAERLDVLNSFCADVGTQSLFSMGITYAQSVLERALGVQRSREMLRRVTEATAPRPFAGLTALDPAQLAALLSGEHPQTIALVLSHLDPSAAAIVLRSLSPQDQGEVAERVATMERTNPALISSVAEILERKTSALFGTDLSRTGGVDVVVGMLNQVDRSTERGILTSMEALDPDLADEIRRRMFLFEDFRQVDDRSIQQIIRAADQHDVVLALKAASDEIAQLFFRNMSQRMADVIGDDLRALGPTRVRDVEAAQQRIVALARRLEESGEVILGDSPGDVLQ